MKELLLIVALGHGADMTTSLMSFHRGAYEVNPLVLSERPVPFLIEGTATAAVEIWALNKLSKKHPKLAKTLSYIQIGGSSAAAVNNMQVYRRLGRGAVSGNSAIHMIGVSK